MNAKRFTPILFFALCILFTVSACAAKSKTIAQAPTQRYELRQQGQVVQETAVVKEVATQLVSKVVTQMVEVAPAAQPTAIPGSIPTPVDNYFQDYGVNPLIETSRDHLSTFAIDVDTASYSVMRSYLADGNLPPTDAVRVEEFVNYFDQEYPTPSDVAFGIYADGAPSPFEDGDTYILRFGIQGYRVPAKERKPLVLTFIIDVSGSMADEGRLDLVKQSLALLVDQLGPRDTVGIVAYTTDALKVLDPVSG